MNQPIGVRFHQDPVEKVRAVEQQWHASIEFHQIQRSQFPLTTDHRHTASRREALPPRAVASSLLFQQRECTELVGSSICLSKNNQKLFRSLFFCVKNNRKTIWWIALFLKFECFHEQHLLIAGQRGSKFLCCLNSQRVLFRHLVMFQFFEVAIV